MTITIIALYVKRLLAKFNVVLLCKVVPSKDFAPNFWIVIDSYVLHILLQVDGDTSTNDTVIALASGLSGLGCISSLDSDEAIQLQACLDAVKLTLYNTTISSLFCHLIFILFH